MRCVQGTSIELHLCEQCARERGFSTTGNKIDISLGGLFSGVADGSAEVAGKAQTCPVCGFTVSDIKKLNKAGCADCYRHFRGDIISILRRDGIELAYTGPLPVKLEAFRATSVDPENLRKELQRAIDQEDYELAAYYRDRIRAVGGIK
jgi:protein arginine kinase activator